MRLGRIVLIIFIAVFILGCREDLIHLSSELDANRVLFALRDAGVEANKRSLGKEWVVGIAQVDLTKALRVLEEKKVLQESVENIAEANNVFQSKEEKNNLRDKDLSKTLSSSIRLIPLVKEARVHIYNSFNDPLAIDVKNERSASVLIVHEHGEVNADLVKELVSRGAGLIKENVSVLFVLAEKKNDSNEVVKNLNIISPVEEQGVSADSQNFTLENVQMNIKSLLSHEYALSVLSLFLFLFLLGFRVMRSKKNLIPRSRILNKLKEERLKNEHI